MRIGYTFPKEIYKTLKHIIAYNHHIIKKGVL